jgi:hypothetical protein
MTFGEILIGGIGLKNHFAFLIDIDARDIKTGKLKVQLLDRKSQMNSNFTILFSSLEENILN